MNLRNNKNKENDDYNFCFGCGKDNPIGLNLKFDYNDQEAISYFSLDTNFEGFPGIIHGGIVSTILDEAMAKTLLNSKILAVTIQMKTKFRKSLRSNKKYKVIGKIIKEKKRTILTEAKIYNIEDELIAECEGKFFKRNR